MARGVNTAELYKNRAWLWHQYIDLGKSDQEIADMAGLQSHASILLWRRKFGIPGHRWKPFAARDELWRLYHEEGLTDSEIGEIYGVEAHTVTRLRKRFNIPSRPKGLKYHLRYANHLDLTPVAKEFIEGELLGDGSIIPHSRYAARFVYGSQHLLYIHWLAKQLAGFGIQQSGKIRAKMGTTNKKKKTFGYASLSYPELFALRKRWYPKGQKTVPTDLRLTPIVVRQWFIGDGYLRIRPHQRPSIVLSTDGFDRESIFALRKKLLARGIETTTQRYGKGYRIYVRTSATPAFFSFIGPCPSEIESIYGYKWRVA